MSLSQGDSTAHVRMDAMNRETMQDYFTLLKDTLEREEAKNRREAELKKRSEEHAKKAELKAKQKAQKEEEKTRKAKGRAASAGRKRAGDNERKRKPAKHPRTDHSSSSAFDQSECCICFVTYEDDQSGKDWVECACGRWTMAARGLC